MTTRSDIEAEIIGRIGPWLAAVSMDGVTVNGTNPDLNRPISYAIRLSGGTVAGATVTDADAATVPASALDQLYDLAELRSLENALTHYALVDAKAGTVEEKSSQFADRLEKRIAALRSAIAIAYGIGGAPSLTGGALTLNFAEESTL